MAGRKPQAFLTEVDLRRPVQHRLRGVKHNNQHALGISPNEGRKGKGRGATTANQAQQRSAPFCTYSQLAVTLGALANMPQNTGVTSTPAASEKEYRTHSSRSSARAATPEPRMRQPEPDTEGLEIVSTAVPQLTLPPRPASSIGNVRPNRPTRVNTPPDDAELQKMLQQDPTQIPTPSTMHNSQGEGSIDKHNPFTNLKGQQQQRKRTTGGGGVGWQPLASHMLPQLESHSGSGNRSTSSSVITPSSQQELMSGAHWHKMRMAEVASSGGDLSSISSLSGEEPGNQHPSLNKAPPTRLHRSTTNSTSSSINSTRPPLPTPSTVADTKTNGTQRTTTTLPQPQTEALNKVKSNNDNENTKDRKVSMSTAQRSTASRTSTDHFHELMPDVLTGVHEGQSSASSDQFWSPPPPNHKASTPHPSSVSHNPTLQRPSSSSASSQQVPHYKATTGSNQLLAIPNNRSTGGNSNSSCSVVTESSASDPPHPNKQVNSSAIVQFHKPPAKGSAKSVASSQRSASSSGGHPLKRLFELEERVRQNKDTINDTRTINTINTTEKYDEMMSIVQELKAIAQTPGSHKASSGRPTSSIALSSTVPTE